MMTFITEVDADGQEWDDLLGTGTIMRQVLRPGRRPTQDEEDGISLEAPRKFFALIDIETRLHDQPLVTESHKNFLINNEADLFPGTHLVIPLMEIEETSRYIFDSKFTYGPRGNPPQVKPDSRLECLITLKFRAPYDEFLEQLTFNERHQLASRKKERGIFWYTRGDYDQSISMFQSIIDLCQVCLDEDEAADDSDKKDANLPGGHQDCHNSSAFTGPR